MDFDEQFTDMQLYLNVIKKAYLLKHLKDPLSTPEDYDLDIKSLCILCHATFEEFIEIIVINVMQKAIKSYVRELKITKPLLNLMHFKGTSNKFLDKDIEKLTLADIGTVFDYNRNKLEEIGKSFSAEVFHNHGISLKYLVKLLIPVSIDIPKNVNWINSLEKLASERGAYAHKYLSEGRIQQSIDPEEANSIITDCTDLCNNIKDKAKKLFE